MQELKLNEAEKDLCRRARQGKQLELKPTDTIHAEVIRRLVLGLPFDKKTGLIASITSFFDDSDDSISCSKAVVGIRIKGGIVKNRLELASAAGPDGGPLCPLEFRGCRFDGGFAGAHGRFARLSFRECMFQAREGGEVPVGEGPEAAIDLSGASLGSELDMRSIRPAVGNRPLWIRAPGLRVDGSVDLSSCRLRAPPSKDARHSDEGAAKTLDLMLAEIKGELTFLNGNARGGIFSLAGARIDGDVWLSGARIVNPGGMALFLQSTRIGGFLMMDPRPVSVAGGQSARRFRCVGKLKLEAAEIRCGLYLREAIVRGELEAPGLSVRGDAMIDATITGPVELRGCRIGGSLDLSRFRLCKQTKLSLADGTIDRMLRLAWDENDHADRIAANPNSHCPSDFHSVGAIDLRGLTCDTLDDQGGRLWGRPPRIHMNHFVYRQATWGEKERGVRKPSDRRWLDWAQRAAADRFPLWPAKWLSLVLLWPIFLHESFVQWTSWQIRRNWIYRQFKRAPGLIHPARHKIAENEYHSQPFEQAVRVARAEGREDIATRFEMLKSRIEWRLFNLRIRWLLGAVGIAVATVWMLLKGSSFWLSLLTLGLTGLLMLWASKIHKLTDGNRILTEFIFYAPAFYFVLVLDGWWRHPFHFIVAVLLYLGVRYMSDLANWFMRLGFGYLRRPGRAVVTLIFAFMLGWWGVHHANKRNMLVIAAEPVATRAAPNENAGFPAGYDAKGTPDVTGSERVAGGPGFAHELSCAAVVGEPLYALDVLIPLVDLGEERRCEVRRFRDAEHGRRAVNPRDLTLGQIFAAGPALPLDDYRFWWWMKALYAIAGWIIVSLSLLTFAQANKTHAEPPGEKH
jgi:hypothetical protein